MSVPQDDLDQLTASLWQLTLGRASKDSLMTAMATNAFLLADPQDVLAVALDASIESLCSLAEVLQNNPACLAGAVLDARASRYSWHGLAVLAGAEKILKAADETHESSAPHDECHPWPAEIQVPRSRGTDGGTLFQEIVSTAAGLSEPDRPEAFGLAIGGAEVLADLTWGRANSDPVKFSELLRGEVASRTQS